MGQSMAVEQKEIVDWVASGNFYEVACMLAGVELETFYRWMEQGKERRDEVSRAFYLEVKRAEAKAEAERLQVVLEAAETNWRAAQWLLEKRFPDKWGPTRNRSDARQTKQDREAVRAFNPRKWMKDFASIREVNVHRPRDKKRSTEAKGVLGIAFGECHDERRDPGFMDHGCSSTRQNGQNANEIESSNQPNGAGLCSAICSCLLYLGTR